MQVKINTQQITLNPILEGKVNRTVEKLTGFADRISDESSEIKVDLMHEDSRSTDDAFVCCITIFAPQSTLRAEARSATIENAIDETEAKLRKQIEHYKNKLHRINERGK